MNNSRKSFRWLFPFSIVFAFLVAVLLFWRKIFDFILTPLKWLTGTVKPTDSEKEKYKELRRLKVKNPTISVSEAVERSNMIYNSIHGYGVNQFQLLKAVASKQSWGYFDDQENKLSNLGLDSSSASVGDVRTTFYIYRDTLQLSDDDYTLIAKQFGIKNAYTSWLTLPEYLKSQGIDNIYNLYSYLFRNTPIQF